VDALQAALDAELKQKEEAVARKKKTENSIEQLQREIEELKRINTDMQGINKKVHSKLSEQQLQLEASEKLAVDRADLASAIEKKFNALNSEMTEIILVLQNSEKARKDALVELKETKDRLLEETIQKGSQAAERRQMSETIAELRARLEEASELQRSAEEKARVSGGAVIELNGRLRQSRDELGAAEKLRKSLECQVGQLKASLDEAEISWAKSSRREMEILENKVTFLLRLRI
jgi:hypothetical protein